MDMILGKIQEMVKDKEAWHATIQEVSMHWLNKNILKLSFKINSLRNHLAFEQRFK